jgi:deoxyribodipyrimidine photo-lyase
MLRSSGIAFHDLKDQAIFDGDNEVLTQAGKPFSVFTPYKNAWLKRLTAADYAAYASSGHLAAASWLASPRWPISALQRLILPPWH